MVRQRPELAEVVGQGREVEVVDDDQVAGGSRDDQLGAVGADAAAHEALGVEDAPARRVRTLRAAVNRKIILSDPCYQLTITATRHDFYCRLKLVLGALEFDAS